MKPYKLHIKNQTEKTIDICCGINTEFTLSPEEEITINVQDGDYFYIDQAIDPEEKTKEVVIAEDDCMGMAYMCECGHPFVMEKSEICPECGAKINWEI